MEREIVPQGNEVRRWQRTQRVRRVVNTLRPPHLTQSPPDKTTTGQSFRPSPSREPSCESKVWRNTDGTGDWLSRYAIETSHYNPITCEEKFVGWRTRQWEGKGISRGTHIKLDETGKGDRILWRAVWWETITYGSGGGVGDNPPPPTLRAPKGHTHAGA
jgi:hypothetical protein